MITSVSLSDEERALVDRCLLMIPDFIDGADEFHTVVGFCPDELAQLVPVGAVLTGEVLTAAISVIGNLLRYPHRRNEVLEARVDRAVLEGLLTRMVGLPGLTQR